MENYKRYILLFSYLLGGILFASAQNWVNVLGSINQVLSSVNQQIKSDRSSVRNAINNWRECKGGAVSKSYGIVALYGNNGYYATSDVPNTLKQTLSSINSQKEEIKDVTITKNGNWLVLYNESSCTYHGIPNTLAEKLNSLSDENIWSVSFNDGGDWVIITNLRIYCSSTDINAFLKGVMHEKGDILSVNVSETGLIACCENGFSFYGAVPASVIDEANSVNFVPKFIKFDNYGNYLICSENASYKYCLYDMSNMNYEVTNYAYNYSNPSNNQVKQSLIPNNIQTNPYYPANNNTQSASRTCRGCNGTGLCTMCNGKGTYWNDTGYYVGKDIKTRTRCSACNGTGKCKVCYGKGTL